MLLTSHGASRGPLAVINKEKTSKRSVKEKPETSKQNQDRCLGLQTNQSKSFLGINTVSREFSRNGRTAELFTNFLI